MVAPRVLPEHARKFFAKDTHAAVASRNFPAEDPNAGNSAHFLCQTGETDSGNDSQELGLRPVASIHTGEIREEDAEHRIGTRCDTPPLVVPLVPRVLEVE